MLEEAIESDKITDEMLSIFDINDDGLLNEEDLETFDGLI